MPGDSVRACSAAVAHAAPRQTLKRGPPRAALPVTASNAVLMPSPKFPNSHAMRQFPDMGLPDPAPHRQ